MVKINLTLELAEVEQIVAALTAQGTPEAVRLAQEITMVRRQHKVMFGIATQRICGKICICLQCLSRLSAELNGYGLPGAYLRAGTIMP